MKKTAAFSMMEIIVVMIIMGILATIAVPNITNSIHHAQVMDAKNNLLSLYAGQLNNFSKTGNYHAPVECDEEAAAVLGVNIAISNNMVYCCGTDPSGFICTATGNDFTMQVTNKQVIMPPNNSPYPRCTTTANPCCTADSTNCT